MHILILLLTSQAFFFAKWTRYMIPTLPFIYLIIAVAFSNLLSFRALHSKDFTPSKNINTRSLHAAFALVGMTSVTFAFAYFITAFVKPDTRIAAYHVAQQVIPPNATILSEVYDLGIVPFNQSFSNISLFNFYDLDSPANIAPPNQSDYIILFSQRIVKTRLSNKEQFPKGYAFYKRLLNGNLGYQKIYETPCDIFCKITYLGDPVFHFEQTTNVFDRPTVMIFKKQ